MANLNTPCGQMANAVSSYKTLFGCDYHRLTNSTLQDARTAKTVKDVIPLVMDDGHFAEFVNNHYNNDAEPTKTADQKLKEDLNYWDYNEEEQDALKENLKEFIGYFNVKIKKAAAPNVGAS